MPNSSSLTIVEDVLVTESFLIKGRLENKSRRLSDLLEQTERMFISVADATMVALRGQEVIRTPKVMVNRSELLFAHELLDTASDAELRRMSMDAKSVRVRAFYSGPAQLELSGMVERGAYEHAHNSGRRYFVMRDPVIRGLNIDGNPELGLLKKLGYAIVRKDRMSYVYDFS